MPGRRPLFGGAIEAEVPSKLIDASELRQVPDTQEVLLSPDSDVTLIVEVLQRVDKDDLGEAISFHFDSLAHDNSASSSSVTQIFALPGTTPSPTFSPSSLSKDTPTPSPLALVGEQQVPKFGKQELNDRVRIWLALWRLSPAKNVDLVLSVNEPLKGDDVLQADDTSSSSEARDLFEKAVTSLKIQDWNLFSA
ncbi:Mog1p/PsbP-like protein [Acaromyces ingoldii]|uniref:Mog1p/PsbP-like protein n=1 Tax=Acaromyces ingoldii TaxID=215250 RepID=A0A316YF81_9BASI|nr:Mog1p/PsbP-like protein [Acaromyces ingoldii]PWN88210.1 Mog1p/PsbP-like protein [Acaromyces ingoldii]